MVSKLRDLIDEDGACTMSVQALAELADPFSEVCWSSDLDHPITREEIRSAIDERNFCAEPLAETSRHTRSAHVSRIAWFVVHGWSDPISVDVGVPGYPGYRADAWVVTDGNHRFAAALYRGDPTIAAEFGGSLSFAEELRIIVQ